MPILTDDELAQIRSDFSEFLSDSCDIKERTNTGSGPVGEPLDPALTTVAAGIACRLLHVPGNVKSSATELAGQQVVGEAYELLLPTTTTVEAGQFVTIDSITYRIIDIQQRVSDKFLNRYLIMRWDGTATV